ncbi:MAG: hypothetical protein ABIT36_05990 [Steroidobacteraceae bacterium]
MAAERIIPPEFDAWTQRFIAHVDAKGKVPPGRWRAYGFEPSGHFLPEARLAWRDIRMRIGRPRTGSSAHLQQTQDLNRDATLWPSRSEVDRQK